jgi:hypothetical protein
MRQIEALRFSRPPVRPANLQFWRGHNAIRDPSDMLERAPHGSTPVKSLDARLSIRTVRRRSMYSVASLSISLLSKLGFERRG